MGTTAQRFDALQRRNRWFGIPIAVFYKFFDDQGVYLAVLITHYAFLSIFPLLLISSSILGFVLRGNAELQERILDSALRQFPVIGQQLGEPEQLRGSAAAIVIGLVGSTYGSLGVSLAVQNAMNVAWAVPRNRRPNPIQLRLRGARLLVTVGFGFAFTTVLSAASRRVGGFGSLAGTIAKLGTPLLAIAVTALMFSAVMRMATTRRVTLRQSLPGAVTAAVVWQLLQLGGAAYIRLALQGAGTTNGVFALVLGLVAWLYLGAASLVLCAEINVVLVEGLHPRALLTPFTERVNLTQGDQAAYASYARAQRHKEYERIDVRFGPSPVDPPVPVEPIDEDDDPLAPRPAAFEPVAGGPPATPPTPEAAAPPSLEGRAPATPAADGAGSGAEAVAEDRPVA